MNDKKTWASSFKMFANLKILICAAIFIAISIVLGKFIPILNFDVLRFSLENLTIVLSGIIFGPFVGAVVGTVADLLGCVMVGYTINPVVTLGAAAIGFFSGLFSFFIISKPLWLKVLLSELAGHVIGSVIIKTLGLAVYYDTPILVTMSWRLLNYCIISAIEFAIIFLALKSRGVQKALKGLYATHKSKKK